MPIVAIAVASSIREEAEDMGVLVKFNPLKGKLAGPMGVW